METYGQLGPHLRSGGCPSGTAGSLSERWVLSQTPPHVSSHMPEIHKMMCIHETHSHRIANSLLLIRWKQMWIWSVLTCSSCRVFLMALVSSLCLSSSARFKASNSFSQAGWLRRTPSLPLCFFWKDKLQTWIPFHTRRFTSMTDSPPTPRWNIFYNASFLHWDNYRFLSE